MYGGIINNSAVEGTWVSTRSHLISKGEQLPKVEQGKLWLEHCKNSRLLIAFNWETCLLMGGLLLKVQI